MQRSPPLAMRPGRYFVPSKTFSRNKTNKIVHLVPLKTFSRNKMRAHQILAVYDARFGKGEGDEISHAARAFSLLLAGGALARVMKLTAGGRGAFSSEGLYRSGLLTAFK